MTSRIYRGTKLLGQIKQAKTTLQKSHGPRQMTTSTEQHTQAHASIYLFFILFHFISFKYLNFKSNEQIDRKRNII
jgi:hypothetical protein